MIRVGMGVGLDFICKVSVSSGRPPGTPRSLRLSVGGRHAARRRRRPRPRPGSASFRVGGRRRAGCTEHAQLGGRTAEAAAASARVQSAQPAAPGRNRPPVRADEGRGAPGPRSRPRAAPSAATSPEVAVPVAWAENLTCARRAEGGR